MMPSPLSEARIQAALRSKIFGRPFRYLASTGSTNQVCKEMAAAGAPAGTLVIADQQTAGKGRLGRQWVAPPNTCLLFSLLFRPELAPSMLSRLTMLCSLAAAEAIDKEAGLVVGIKWPNDLIISSGGTERKVAGLLAESAVVGDQLLYAVVGMGINVNVVPDALGEVMAPATSLQTELGNPVDRVSLLGAILAQIENRYAMLMTQEITDLWSGRLITLGQQVVAHTTHGQLQGIAEGVEMDGALLLRDSAGHLHRLQAGDVSLRGLT